MQSINSGFQSLKTLIPHSDGEKLSKVGPREERKGEKLSKVGQTLTCLLDNNKLKPRSKLQRALMEL